ncbi:MAG: hypothetical protein IPN71_04100 [Fibrobacteres bacterium]|nr:hypothetical protein [Fibrobacterota bacterium]
MIWVLVVHSWFAAFEARLPAAAVEGRGGPSVAWAGDGDPLDANPALAAVATNRAELGGGLTRPLGFSDLGLGGLWARAKPWGGLGLAVRWKSLGAGEIYREDAWGADLAWRSGSIAVGAGLRAGHVNLEGENLGGPWGGAAGIRAQVVEGLSLAASLEDPSLWTSGRMSQPWLVGLGAALSGKDTSWAGDVSLERREGWGWSGKMGQELRLEPLRFRAGLRANPWTISVGIGGGVRNVRLDWAMEGEPILGWQHHISMAWSL